MPIRELAPGEAHRLLPILRQVHDLHLHHQPERFAPLPGDADLTEYLRGWLAQPNVFALGYERVTILTGYAIYALEQRPATPFQAAETRAMLHQIGVDETHRRQGIGQALIGAIRRRLDPETVPVLTTTYASFNLPSQALMANAGFDPVLIQAEWRLRDTDHAP